MYLAFVLGYSHPVSKKISENYQTQIIGFQITSSNRSCLLPLPPVQSAQWCFLKLVRKTLEHLLKQHLFLLLYQVTLLVIQLICRCFLPFSNIVLRVLHVTRARLPPKLKCYLLYFLSMNTSTWALLENVIKLMSISGFSKFQITHSVFSKQGEIRRFPCGRWR